MRQEVSIEGAATAVLGTDLIRSDRFKNVSKDV
jgi:hypothetical protein